jgi:hypothetical protein
MLWELENSSETIKYNEYGYDEVEIYFYLAEKF